MRAAITGASGLLGGNLAAILVAAGHRVVAIRRSARSTAHLADLPEIDWRAGALGDPASLAAAFAGADVVFHCAASVGVKREVTAELHDTNVTGTEHVIAACLAAKVPRLVHVSSVVAVGLSTTGQPSDETARWNFDELGLVDGYAITKRQAEDRVDAAVRTGDLDAVIVNPTYMFGPRDARPSSGKLIVDTVRRKVPGWTPGYNNFVDARDVARGMVAAAAKGRRGERYILAGHDLTYRQIFETIARVAHVEPPRLPVPYPIARLVGWWGDRVEARGGDPIVNSTQIRYAFTDKFRFASTKARDELGYTFGPIEPAIADALAEFRRRGLV